MGFISRLGRAWVGLTARDGTPSGDLPLLQGLPSSAGVRVSQISSMAVSTVYACITIRSKDVARCAPRLMLAEGARSEKPIINHPIAKLFRRPNRWQTWFEFATQMHASFLLRGNAYAAILQDNRGNPTDLIPINPDAVLLHESPDGSIFYRVARYGFFQMAALSSLPDLIPEGRIFHLRAMSFNMLSGLSTIGIARDSIGVAIGLEQQAARFIANGARPSGVLKSAKELSETAGKRLRAQWEAWRSGINNVGRTAILEDGVEYQPLQLTSVDLEFMAQRKFSIEDVARFWGMPLHKLAVTGESAKIKIDQADQEYVNTTIMPDLDIWEQKFAQKFGLDDEGIIADFDERRLLRAEEATRINNQRLQVMSGLKTQNECRALEGDPPMEGGDVLLRPINLASSGSDMSGTAPDGAGRPQDGNLPDPGAANADPSKRYNDNHDASGKFGSGGGGSKVSAIKDAVTWMKETPAQEVIKSIASSEKAKEGLSFALQSLLSHATGLDQSTWKLNEELIDHTVSHFGDIASLSAIQARGMMQSALNGLVHARQVAGSVGHAVVAALPRDGAAPESADHVLDLLISIRDQFEEWLKNNPIPDDAEEKAAT